MMLELQTGCTNHSPNVENMKLIVRSKELIDEILDMKEYLVKNLSGSLVVTDGL